MNKLKISFAAIAFIAALGITAVSSASSKKTFDCSSVKNGTFDRNQSACTGSQAICCWVGSTVIPNGLP